MQCASLFWLFVVVVGGFSVEIGHVLDYVLLMQI
jgi:hypothetical protein